MPGYRIGAALGMALESFDYGTTFAMKDVYFAICVILAAFKDQLGLAQTFASTNH